MPGEQDGFAAGMAGGLQDGAQIAGYRLEEQIGQGGMAVIFRARDGRLGRVVALKILAPALAADDAFRRRFIRESQAAAAVDDPHIIPVFEAGEAGGVLFLAMRYVPGGDARTLVRREGALPPGRAAAIVSPVALALDSAHAAGLVHRDVKPSNMLMDVRPGRPDHVYLSDFGLSKAAGRDRAHRDGPVPRHPGVHRPGADPGPAGGRARRSVCAGLLGVRAAGRRAAVRAGGSRRADVRPPVRAAAALSTRGRACPGARTRSWPRRWPRTRRPGTRAAGSSRTRSARRSAWAPTRPGFAAGSGPAATVPSRRSLRPRRSRPRSRRRGASRPPSGRAADGGRGGTGRQARNWPAARGTRGWGDIRRPAPRRRRTRAALTGIAVLAVAGVTAGFLLAGSPGPPAAHVTIAARSSLAPVGGDVYVGYRQAGRPAPRYPARSGGPSRARWPGSTPSRSPTAGHRPGWARPPCTRPAGPRAMPSP